MTLISDAEPVTWPAEARQVFDVTGAGDTVIALLGAGVAAGLSFAAAAQLANLAAGLVVRKIGAAAVTVSELKLALHQRRYRRSRRSQRGGPGSHTLQKRSSVASALS